MKQGFILGLCFLMLCRVLYGDGPEKEKAPLAISLKVHYGFVIIHSRDIRPIGDSYPWGIQADLSWHYNTKKAYNRCLCFPRLGVSLYYWNFDNPDILGHGLTSIFFVEPFFGAHHKFSFSFRAGFGLAYANKPYDEISNPDNLSYSTYFSFPIILAATLNYEVNNRFRINLSANYNHISNGGMKEPNKGINYPTASLGVDYYLRQGDFEPDGKPDWKQDGLKRNKFYIGGFGTAKQLNEKGELKRYPVVGLAGRFSRQVSRINAVSFGFEAMGDGAHKEEIARDSLDKDHHMAGILVGNEFLLGKFLFGQQFGVYVYDPYKRNTIAFQRYWLDFKFFKSFYFGVGLKAHGHVADFLDIRVRVFW